MKPLKHIGLWGGTFNPPHLAHIYLPQLVLSALNLDQVLWLPSKPWQKTSVLNAAYRLHMLNLLFNKPIHWLNKHYQQQHSIETLELWQIGASYTFNTLQLLKQKYGQAHYYLIIGQDQWENIHTWKQSQLLLTQVKPVVLARSVQGLQALPNHLNEAIQPIYLSLDDLKHSLNNIAQQKNVNPQTVQAILKTLDLSVEISSTQLRKLVQLTEFKQKNLQDLPLQIDLDVWRFYQNIA